MDYLFVFVRAQAYGVNAPLVGHWAKQQWKVSVCVWQVVKQYEVLDVGKE